jgi:hypothetical protein
LSWSHFLDLLPIKDPLARDFYAEMCRIERWDVRTLRQKIAGMLFQRTALSKNTKEVISAEIGQLRDGRVTPEAVFRDPYFLDFLGLKGAYSERDLEAAILREMGAFFLRWARASRSSRGRSAGASAGMTRESLILGFHSWRQPASHTALPYSAHVYFCRDPTVLTARLRLPE